MTDTTTQTPGEVQEQARETYRQSVAVGMPLSGAALGKMFDKSDRWGRLRITECQPETPDGNAGGTGAGMPEGQPEPERQDPGNAGSDEPRSDPVPPVVDPEPELVVPDPVPVPEAVNPQVVELPVVGNAVPISGTQGGTERAAVPVVEAEVPAAVPAEPSSVPVAVPAETRVRRSDAAWAWAAFLLGSAASIAGNVGHGNTQWQAQLSGAFWPVALIVSVELMSRPIWRSGKAWSWARYAGTGLVALVTAITSYWHMRAFLIKYGETEALASIGPLAVDGLMIIAGFAILSMSKKRNQS